MATFPKTISLSDVPASNGYPGPFLAPNGFLYCLMTDGAALAVFKSSDDGLTWSIQDSLHAPTFGGGGNIAGCLGGSVIWAVSVDVTDSVEQVSSFDTLSDTWTGNYITANARSGNRLVAICLRPDGTLVICGNGATAFWSGDWWRTSYFLFDTSTFVATGWMANGLIGAGAIDWECDAILLGSGEVDFLFWSHDHTAPGGTRAIWRQPLLDSNTLGSLVMLDSITDAGSSPVTPGGFSDGATAVIAWVPTDQAPLSVSVFSGPVFSWSLSSQVLLAPATEDGLDDIAVISAAGSFSVFLATHVNDGAIGNWWVSLNAGVPNFLGSVPLWNWTQDSLSANSFLTGASPWGIMFWDSTPQTLFWDLAGVSPTTQIFPLQFIVFSFPAGPDCCDPCGGEDVACIRPTKNGKLFATTKGILKEIQ